MQHVGIIRAFCLSRAGEEGGLLRFLVPGETENIALLCFIMGGSVPRLTLWTLTLSLLIKLF